MPWVEIQRSVHTKYKSTSNTDWNEIQRWWNSPREILEKWNPNPCRENWAKPSLTWESPHVGEALESPANPPRRCSPRGAIEKNRPPTIRITSKSSSPVKHWRRYRRRTGHRPLELPANPWRHCRKDLTRRRHETLSSKNKNDRGNESGSWARNWAGE